MTRLLAPTPAMASARLLFHSLLSSAEPSGVEVGEEARAGQQSSSLRSRPAHHHRLDVLQHNVSSLLTHSLLPCVSTPTTHKLSERRESCCELVVSGETRGW